MIATTSAPGLYALQFGRRGRRTFSTMSASRSASAAVAAMVAPAASNSASGRPAATPAPAWTTTSAPRAVYFLTVSGDRGDAGLDWVRFGENSDPHANLRFGSLAAFGQARAFSGEVDPVHRKIAADTKQRADSDWKRL